LNACGVAFTVERGRRCPCQMVTMDNFANAVLLWAAGVTAGWPVARGIMHLHRRAEASTGGTFDWWVTVAHCAACAVAACAGAGIAYAISAPEPMVFGAASGALGGACAPWAFPALLGAAAGRVRGQ
jgi:hypothetical protein